MVVEGKLQLHYIYGPSQNYQSCFGPWKEKREKNSWIPTKGTWVYWNPDQKSHLICVFQVLLCSADSQVQPGLTGVILIWWDKSWNLLACILLRMQLMSWNNKIFLVTLTTKRTVNNTRKLPLPCFWASKIYISVKKYKYALCTIVTLSRWGGARMVYPFFKIFWIFYSPFCYLHWGKVENA